MEASESDDYLCGTCGKIIRHGDTCNECSALEDEEYEMCFEELLISEVSRRRELWDPSIELKLRGPAITARSWAAIDEALNIEPGTAKKRWKTLRDFYARKLAEEKKYVPSGSGASQTSTIKWKYFASLDFLRPTIGYRKTFSNNILSQPSTSNASVINNNSRESRSLTPHSDTSSIQSAETLAKTGSKKRRLNSSGSSDTGFESSLLEAIQHSTPSLPSIDEIGAFCKFLEMRLRNVDIRTYRKMSHLIMKTMMNIESELPEYAEKY